MKRLICMLLLVVMVASLFVGYGSFTCDLCGKKKSGEKHEEKIMGKEVVCCDDCYEASSLLLICSVHTQKAQSLNICR